MTVLKEYNDSQCLERYGRYYIRFWIGYNDDFPCEFPISEEAMKKVLADASEIDRLIDNADTYITWTEESFYKLGICEYMLHHLKLSQNRTEQAYEKLSRHFDIRREFYYYIMGVQGIWKPVTVEGYTAEHILKETSLNSLGAYNYLIYLREKPEEALMNLKKGLPIRRIFKPQEAPITQPNAEDLK